MKRFCSYIKSIIIIIAAFSLVLFLSAPTYAASTPTQTIEKKLKESYKGNKDHVKFKYIPETHTAAMSLTSDSFWDEQSAVNGAVNSLISYGKSAFKIKGVENVSVAYRSTFTDAYGKNSTEDIVKIVMAKTEYKKYSWDNLKFRPIYPQLKLSSISFYINPAVLRKIDLSKIKYTGI